MEVTIRELRLSAAALRRIASNAKIQTVLFFKLVNAARDMNAALEPVDEKLRALGDEHTEIVDEDKTLQVFKSTADKIAHAAKVKEVDAQVVDLPRVKAKIPWSLLEANDKAAKDETGKINMTPVELVDLAWLIDFESEAEDKPAA